MRSDPVNNGGTGTKGLAELNYHMRYEHKEVRDGVVGEGQGLSEEDESRIIEVSKDVNEGPDGAVKAQDGLQQQQQQQQPQGPEVRWERFLPLRSLKVLLVENDDSTRQIVTALLRNCSYEVTAVANGLHAWKILQDLNNQIDLILTEVFMPCLSGIGLLSKVMNHKTCKNIPMIMMSSHDSMGIVFKCLSKGAVDFLVKPIRKNELKNLWQHVWRRCHSSSGSGSESGIRTQKSAKSKSVEESDNNTGSNDDDDNTSYGLNARDGSDNGSGTQSSWTKRAVEVDSPQPMLPWDQLSDPPDSTCALVTHPRSEALGNEWVPITAKKECEEQDDNVAMGKDLEIGAPRNPDAEHEYPSEKVCTNLIGTKQDKLPELDPEKHKEKLDDELLELNIDKPIGELTSQATEHIGLNTINTNPQLENRNSEAFKNPSFSEIKDRATSDAKEQPSLELSLKRLRGIGDSGTVTHDDRNVLRHSDLSAFSRYNTASTANQAPTGNVGSCSPVDNSSEAMKTESMYNQRSNGSSNNNDVGSSTKNVFNKPAALNEKSTSTSTARCLHPSPFQPVQNNRACPPPKVMPQKADDVVVNTVVGVGKSGGANQQVQVQHHHHHYHHHHHHVHNMQQQQPPQDHDDLSLNMATTALQCSSSNVFGGPIEVNAGNYSLNASASGSNHGSNNKPSGSNKDMNAGGINIENGDGVAGESGVGGSGGSGVDQNRFTQREAALTKFRQKRKERCFEKKVRYQSRKRLAEQRPRVRGQFVRQRVYDTNREADC